MAVLIFVALVLCGGSVAIAIALTRDLFHFELALDEPDLTPTVVIDGPPVRPLWAGPQGAQDPP